MNFKDLKAKNLKKGSSWYKGGMQVSYSAGSYFFSALYDSKRFSTLKEVKKYINEQFKDL